MLQSQETAFVSFYKKSARVLQDVLWLLHEVSTGCSEREFWRAYGGKKVKKWIWRWDEGVMRFRTWRMKSVSDKDGWICSRRVRAMFHKNMKNRSKWGNVASVRQESELEGGEGGIDGVWVGKEVSQVLCKLYSNLFNQRLEKPKT